MKFNFLVLTLWVFTLPAYAQVSQVIDLNPGSGSSMANPQNGVGIVGDYVYFAASNSASGTELWRTDGTAAGTVLVKDIRPGSAGSSPDNFYAVGDQLLFTANNGTNGVELWRSDGTEAGTMLVKEINSGSASAFEDFSDNTIFFAVFDNKLYFAANNGMANYELWVSDGTEVGTVLLKEIYTGASGSFPSYFAVHDGALYFSARQVASGEELWKTDGTAAGTVLVKDIIPGGWGSSPRDLRSLGTTLVFIADDDVHDRELWRTDGTAAGTVLVKDIKTNDVGTFTTSGFETQPNTSENRFAVIGNVAYFSAIDDSTGIELWRTDGTEAGTYRVKDASPAEGFDGYAPQNFTVLGNQLFYKFRTPDTGIELWKSDGTETGTTLVKDIQPGLNSSFSISTFIHPHLDKIYFGADPSGTIANELFVSNGTAGGTQLLADINPGSNASWPNRFVSLGNKLLLWAVGANTGMELYVYTVPLTVSATVTAQVACHGDSSGAVVVQVGIGGTPPYTAVWSSPWITGLMPSNLPAGQYTVTVTSADGATGTASVNVIQPAALALTTTTTPASGGMANGTATVNHTGGTSPFIYSWSTVPPQTTKTAVDLAAGTYEVTVTDSKGCTATATVTVLQSSGIAGSAGEPVALVFQPNPAFDQARWSAGTEQAISGAIYRADGLELRMLTESELLRGDLAVSKLAEGVYLLVLQLKSGRMASARFTVAR